MQVWKNVIGYEGLYEVSNLGNVKRLERKVPHKSGGKRVLPEKILKPGKNKKGYLQVTLVKNGKNKCFKVHRLVAKAFIQNPMKKNQVNHLNGIKNDNKLENLEWCTESENIKHSIKTGLRNYDFMKNSTKHVRKLNKLKASEIRENKNCMTEKELAIKYNVTIQTIRRIKNNKIWKVKQ